MNRTEVRDLAELYFQRFDDRLAKGLAEVRSELLRRMFVFWVGTIVPLAGLVITLLKL